MNAQKLKLIEADILQFKESFVVKHGLEPIVIFRDPNKDVISGMALVDLLKIANACLFNAEQYKVYPDGIKTKTRERIVVIHRYCFIHIARRMHYRNTSIMKFLEWDHATGIHAEKTVKSLLESKDYELATALDCMYGEIKRQSGNDGDVQLNPETGTES
jgi:hypothetical protein